MWTQYSFIFLFLLLDNLLHHLQILGETRSSSGLWHLNIFYWFFRNILLFFHLFLELLRNIILLLSYPKWVLYSKLILSRLALMFGLSLRIPSNFSVPNIRGTFGILFPLIFHILYDKKERNELWSLIIKWNCKLIYKKLQVQLILMNLKIVHCFWELSGKLSLILISIILSLIRLFLELFSPSISQILQGTFSLFFRYAQLSCWVTSEIYYNLHVNEIV